MAARRIGKLAKDSTLFLLCDMQEKFRPSIKYYDDIITVAKRLVDAAKILDIPLIATEQYPKGLGKTVSELEISHALQVCPKTVFSMVIPEVQEKIKQLTEYKSIVLFGIECHVCVQQTCLDLLEKDYEVHIVADACSSRSMVDRMYALERMKQSGAFVTTSESVLLSLVGDSKHPQFKEIQKLIMTSAPESGLLSRI